MYPMAADVVESFLRYNRDFPTDLGDGLIVDNKDERYNEVRRWIDLRSRDLLDNNLEHGVLRGNDHGNHIDPQMNQ